MTGGFTLLSIEQSAEDALRFRVRGNGDNVEAYGRVFLATTAPTATGLWPSKQPARCTSDPEMTATSTGDIMPWSGRTGHCPTKP